MFQKDFLVPSFSFVKNLKREYFTLNKINNGFFLALGVSNFIFVEILSQNLGGILSLVAEFLSPFIAIFALFALLKSNKQIWFWFGFFIGAIWFYWISFSLIYFGLSFLIPVEILGICLIAGAIFRIFAIFDEPIARALCLVGLKFIHPFGFDWLNFELLFSHGIFRAEIFAFCTILVGICILIKFRHKAKILLFCACLICALEFKEKQAEFLPLKIKLENSQISQFDIWDEEKILDAIRENLTKIDEAIESGYEAIVLPESAFALYLNREEALKEILLEKSHKISIVAGAEAYEESKFYNSAYVFENGNLRRFDKHILVPFGEQVPLPVPIRDFINNTFLGGASDFSIAPNFSFYTIKEIPVKSAICYEATRGEFYSDNPKFVVAISNNGWFIPSYEPHLQRLIIRYYATLSGASVYHAINASPSEIITPRKLWVNKFLALFKTA
ncbi:apolipoprotein N-acyltransferase [Campylobacter sp. JMF_06 NA1]|uniref:apolipoprotein N-acyltransferase n=1 Tax=Campylobacter sp. JMF_06 NA1 TaxID=2983823 RepID=UPI0022E9BEC4|nr:apolipoprotein N-acyltransferase [Campylobacter sp. JMF_06 NA1]MDA3077359.1 apolipoprotein N-acyltransferase [Campylobacter sp. JMF_06 NA1]